MAFLVYKLTNSINGKCYIGITSRSLDARWAEHRERARHGKRDSRIHVAMRKYGNDAFTGEVLATAETEDEIRGLETKFIHEHNSYKAGYNCNLGGNGHLHFPEHIRRKISDANLGRVNSPTTRQKMSAAKAGDPKCASNFGTHTQKGAGNPRAIECVVGFPNGDIRRVHGLRAFCREVSIDIYKFKKRGVAKGYVLLDRLSTAVTKTAIAV